MVNRCPKCARPNPPEQKKCIYCGTEISSAPSLDQLKAPKPAPPSKEKEIEISSRLFLIISPYLKEPPKAVVEGLARLLKWDRYLAQLRLKSPAPYLLRAFENVQEAKALCHQLNELGIDAYLIKESGLSQIQEKKIALSAQMSEEKLTFLLEDQTQRDLAFSELFLLVRGRIRAEGELGKKLGKVLLPEMQTSKEKFFDRLVQRRKQKKLSRLEIGALIPEPSTELEVFDLYTKNEPQAIRVIENQFDFSSLFGPSFQARLLGMARLMDLIKSKAPSLIINENFNQIGYTYREKQVDKKTLLPLPKSSKPKSQEKLHSSQSLFTEYSGLIYLYYLRKTQKEQAPPEQSS